MFIFELVPIVIFSETQGFNLAFFIPSTLHHWRTHDSIAWGVGVMP